MLCLSGEELIVIAAFVCFETQHHSCWSDNNEE